MDADICAEAGTFGTQAWNQVPAGGDCWAQPTELPWCCPIFLCLETIHVIAYGAGHVPAPSVKPAHDQADQAAVDLW